MSFSILILTKNEACNLPSCLDLIDWCDDIHVLDSFSSDNTVTIAHKRGAKVTQRVFDNWASHQNWALANIRFKYPWVFYIDADEHVTESLRESLFKMTQSQVKESAFWIRRRDFFLDGTWLKYAQISPYFIRLFRPSKITFQRLVNPIAVVDGVIGELSGYLDHHPFSKGLDFWIQRHIQYANLEAQIIAGSDDSDTVQSFKRAFFSKDFHERRRHQKKLFYHLPCRPLIKFFYLFFLRRAFLDGKAGITYAALQSIYEYFIVLHQRELVHSK